MPTCLIGVGSNLGDRAHALWRAVELLRSAPDVEVLAVSRWYETAPVGGPAGQGAFLNGVIRLESSREPRSLLALLAEIERSLGRSHRIRWQARTVDLDLLMYGDVVIDSHELVVPHPRMAVRRFVLEPAAEIAAELVHPPTGWTIGALWDHLRCALPYVALAGPIAAGKSTLAAALSARREVRLLADNCDPLQRGDFYGDPARLGWPTQLEFLAQRARLLARTTWPSGALWTVSDFWFDQSLAYARIWLDAEQQASFASAFEIAAAESVAPKLTVLLDAPSDVLMARIRARGRPHEQHLGEDFLNRLRGELLLQTNHADRGPVLKLSTFDLAAASDELLAAVDAMS